MMMPERERNKMTDKKKIDEAVTLNVSTQQGEMSSSTSFTAEDTAALVDLLKNAGIQSQMFNGPASLSIDVQEKNGAMSSTIQAPDLRSIMHLLEPEFQAAGDPDFVPDEQEIEPLDAVEPETGAVDATFDADGNLTLDTGEVEEEADYDYRTHDVHPSEYAGKADKKPVQPNTKSVPARSGDNPLAETDEMAKPKYRKAYRAYPPFGVVITDQDGEVVAGPFDDERHANFDLAVLNGADPADLFADDDVDGPGGGELSEASGDPFKAEYDSKTGVYNVVDANGNIVARNVSNSGGAAMSAAASWNHKYKTGQITDTDIALGSDWESVYTGMWKHKSLPLAIDDNSGEIELFNLAGVDHIDDAEVLGSFSTVDELNDFLSTYQVEESAGEEYAGVADKDIVQPSTKQVPARSADNPIAEEPKSFRDYVREAEERKLGN
jgi:hypothetical protein